MYAEYYIDINRHYENVGKSRLNCLATQVDNI